MRDSLSIETLAKHVVEKNTDVIFVDSCAVLDIYRCLSRQNIPTMLARDAERIMSESENVDALNGKVSLVSADLCRYELSDNAQSVKTDVEVWLKRINKEYYSGLQAVNNYSSIDFSYFKELHLTNALQKVSNTYNKFTAALHLCAANDAIRANASSRLVRRIAPAAKGGEYKDCQVYETALSFKSVLDCKGFSKSFVFVTSNTSDFCESRVDLKEPLLSEMNKYQIQFATNLRWSGSILGI